MVTLQEVIDHNTNVDDETVAARWLHDIGITNKEQVQALLPFVTNAVITRRRGVVHAIETEIFNATPRAPLGLGVSYNPLLVRAQFLEQTIVVSRGGRRVAWGDATRQDLRERIEFLAKFRAGIDKTIDGTSRVLAQLEASGANTLRELLAKDPDALDAAQRALASAPDPEFNNA